MCEVIRYEHDRVGDLVHVNIKILPQQLTFEDAVEPTSGNTTTRGQDAPRRRWRVRSATAVTRAGKSGLLRAGRRCTMPGMTYVSPFGDMDTDHEWPDALCLSRTHCANASEETIGEFYEGAIALIDAGVPQPAFFLARQLAELSLKAFVGPGQKDGHDLGKLLKRLQESGDDLSAGDDDRHLVVEFIRDLYARDPRGDQGRYATTKGGDLSLAAVCCANPELFRQHVDRLFLYTQHRISRVGQSA